jgi:hypothetical protein
LQGAHNGYAERLVKPAKLGEKNYTFFGSDNGGHTAACYYTFIQSALLYNLNPEAYLTDVLRRIPNKLYHKLEDLLPHCWKPFNPYEGRGDSPENPVILSKLLALFQQPQGP